MDIVNRTNIYRERTEDAVSSSLPRPAIKRDEVRPVRWVAKIHVRSSPEYLDAPLCPLYPKSREDS